MLNSPSVLAEQQPPTSSAYVEQPSNRVSSTQESSLANIEESYIQPMNEVELNEDPDLQTVLVRFMQTYSNILNCSYIHSFHYYHIFILQIKFQYIFHILCDFIRSVWHFEFKSFVNFQLIRLFILSDNVCFHFLHFIHSPV